MALLCQLVRTARETTHSKSTGSHTRLPARTTCVGNRSSVDSSICSLERLIFTSNDGEGASRAKYHSPLTTHHSIIRSDPNDRPVDSNSLVDISYLLISSVVARTSGRSASGVIEIKPPAPGLNTV